MTERAQKVMNEYYIKLGSGPYYYDNSGVAAALREVANQLQYYNPYEGTDMIIDARAVYDLADELEKI